MNQPVLYQSSDLVEFNRIKSLFKFLTPAARIWTKNNLKNIQKTIAER